MSQVTAFLAPKFSCALCVTAAMVTRATETKNGDGERVGALNKVFGFLYRGRVKMKALKKTNRKLYYAIKWVTLGGLLAASVVWA